MTSSRRDFVQLAASVAGVAGTFAWGSVDRAALAAAAVVLVLGLIFAFALALRAYVRTKDGDRKEFKGEPMSAEEAIYQMEMVGHDFFLFHDSETNKDCVVYRRKGWNYGVITLK